jgi:hypothetical protein
MQTKEDPRLSVRRPAQLGPERGDDTRKVSDLDGAIAWT